MQGFTYPITLTPDKKSGGYVVTCRDVAEVVTQGESLAHAIEEAFGALEAPSRYALRMVPTYRSLQHKSAVSIWSLYL